MSIYDNNNLNGELWLRDLKGKISTGNNVLSSVYSKYKFIDTNFYNSLTSNNIKNFDVFYDVIHIKTDLGSFFEKIYNEDYQIKPFNQINNFIPNTNISYWFDELENKIYYTNINNLTSKNIEFYTDFNIFDCNKGIITQKNTFFTKVGFITGSDYGQTFYKIQNPNLTFNLDTRNFNISFICLKNNTDFGLISLNLENKNDPTITEINGFLPYIQFDTTTSLVSSINS
jgi:hypothetical protein